MHILFALKHRMFRTTLELGLRVGNLILSLPMKASNANIEHLAVKIFDFRLAFKILCGSPDDFFFRLALCFCFF